MPILPETARHEVFHVHVWGDTLVITPRGDAVGFTAQSINAEMATLHEVLRREEVKHLIVDLGHANYFGSIILGALVQLGQVIQSRRGRTALAGASDDMVGVLKLMKLDQMWEFYPTLKAALRSIARIPFSQQVWAQRHLLGTALLCFAIVLLIAFFPRIDYGKRYYVEVSKLWREAEARRELAGEDEWGRFVKRSEAKLEPMLKHLLRRSDEGRSSTAEIYLIYIIRDYWSKALDRTNERAPANAQLVKYYLRLIEAYIEGRVITERWVNNPDGVFGPAKESPDQESSAPDAESPQ